MVTYRDALNYIYSFTNFEVTPAGNYSSRTFDLTRMERLLAALGDPHKRFQSIHVAGTKGKGSTAALIESVLRAAKQRTGLYTSPHLHTFRERIRVGGEMISPDDVVAGVEKCKPLIAQVPGVTTFEVMTALAFDYFAARGVALAVVEVGLGGRLDATNVVLPRVSVITSISYDHTAILGHTLAQIAREKAGVIKPGVPVVTAPQRDEALRVIEAVAREKDAPLVTVTPDLRFSIADRSFRVLPQSQTLDSQTFTLQWSMRLSEKGGQAAALPVSDAQRGWATTPSKTTSNNLELATLNLKLLGRHQRVNAATALAAISVLRAQGIAISDEALRAGLANVQWHGRFEILARNPWVIVDGAHNADSAQQLVAALREFFPTARWRLIFGASGDKDIAGMFAALLPSAASLILTRSRNPRAADPARLAELATSYPTETSVALDLASALRDAARRAEPGDVICVTGSLFVVAEAREAWLADHGVKVERDS